MTSPNDLRALAERLEELRLFLNGEGDLGGYHFGDVKLVTSRRSGAFWWRDELGPITEAQDAILALLEERDRLEKALRFVREQVPITRAYLVENGIDPHFADVLLGHYLDATSALPDPPDQQP